jgi:hypothetical protein
MSIGVRITVAPLEVFLAIEATWESFHESDYTKMPSTLVVDAQLFLAISK